MDFFKDTPSNPSGFSIRQYVRENIEPVAMAMVKASVTQGVEAIQLGATQEQARKATESLIRKHVGQTMDVNAYLSLADDMFTESLTSES